MMRKGSRSSSIQDEENEAKFHYDLRMEELKMRQEQLQNKFNRLKVLYKSKCKALKDTQREMRKINGALPSRMKMKEKRLRRRSRSAPFKASTPTTTTTTPSTTTTTTKKTTTSPATETPKNKTTEKIKTEEDELSRFRSPSFGANRRRKMSEDSENGDMQLPSDDQIDSILREDLILDSNRTTSSLIDHFIVVGLPSSRGWSPKSLVDSTKSSSLASLNGRWKPHILYQHPRGLDASQKFSRLAEFCLPNGAEVRIKPKSSLSSSKPRLHTFMLSGGEEAVYGICLIVSQPLESVDDFVNHNTASSLLVESMHSTKNRFGQTFHHPVTDVATIPEIVLPSPTERSPSLTIVNRTTSPKRNKISKTSSWVSSIFTRSPSREKLAAQLEEKKEEKIDETEKDEDEAYFAETDRCYCILARYPLYSVYSSILSVLLKLASLDREDRKDSAIVTCPTCKERNVCSNRESLFVCYKCGTASNNPHVFAKSTPVCETFRFEDQGSLGLVLAQYNPPNTCDQKYFSVVSQFARTLDGNMMHAEKWGKIRKGAFVSRVGDVDTKDMDYNALIGLFQTNVRPLTVEFKYMEPKRPPPLESVKTNGTLSPPISPDVKRKPEFSPRGTRIRNLRRRLRNAQRRHSITVDHRVDEDGNKIDDETTKEERKMSLEDILDALLSHEPSVGTLQKRGLSHALPASLRKFFMERLRHDESHDKDSEEDDEDVYDGLDSRLSRGHFGEFESHTLWTLAVTLCTFNADQIVSILCNLLLERSLCVCSKDVKMLSPISMSLLLMLRPFVWQSTFIPSLPLSMISFLQAPVPFLVGTMCSLNIDRWPDVTFANVDQRKVHLSHKIPEMPFQSELLKRLGFSIDRLNLVLGRKEYKSNDFFHVLSDEARECLNDTLLMLRAYFTVMLGDIRGHCMRDVTSPSPSDLVFMKDIYVESCNPRYREFVKNFLETQIFTEYFDSHVSETRRLLETTVD